MISTLNGITTEKKLNQAIIDCNGVGYGVYITAEDYGHLNIDQQAKLYIYEYIREQAYDLFGFLSRDTLKLFEQLIGVNGIGPKMALSMLSIGNLTDVRKAIAGGDIKYLQQANGVGKRVAERAVIDLKDKVGLMGVNLDETGLLQAESILIKDEATEALVALGYTASDATLALKGIDSSLSTEERIKQALTSNNK